MKKGLLFLAFLSAKIIYSQVTITVDTPPNLIQNVLLGGGVLASNITSQGNPDQFGSFTSVGGTPIDFGTGIILTTFGITAPNCMQQGGPGYFGAGTAGDLDLSTTAGGGSTTDASWIQFDFVPTGDTIKFDYIFGSQEYNNYVNTGFNDVFAFYLTGPNPGGGNYVSQNVAIIPGTILPVTINNLNNGNAGGCAAGPCEYCSFFVDNNCTPPANGLYTGGYTTGLRVVMPVVPCSTYTIKMGVADLLDNALNSFVMLKASSFSSNSVNLAGNVNFGPADTLLIEACNQAILTFVRTDTTNADTISFSTSGTAIEGIDYSNLPPYVVFPPGEDTVYLTFNPLQDFIIEGPESIILTINDTVCNNPAFSTFHYFILDIDSLDATLMPVDTFVCAGSPLFFDASVTGGVGLFTSIGWENPSGTAFGDSTSVNVSQSGYYVFHVHDFCIAQTYFDSVRIDVFPVPNIALPDQSACSNVGQFIGPGSALTGYNYQWSPGAGLNQTNINSPTFNVANPGPADLLFTYVLVVDSGGVSCYADSMVVTVHPSPIVDLGPDTNYCESSSLTLNAGNPGATYLWNTSAVSQTINVNNIGTYSVLVTSPFTCLGADTINIGIDSLPHFILNDVTVCEGDSAVLWVHSNEGTTFNWSNLETDTLIFTFTPGFYTLTIGNHCGSSTDTAQVKFLPDLTNVQLPNVLTPNGDGLNDEYAIPVLAQATSFRMDFFDRWGALLHSQTDANDSWKGTGQGSNMVPQGTYYVILKFYDCKNTEINRKQFISVFY